MYEILDSGLSRVGEVEKRSSDNHSIHWQSSGTLTLIAAATEGNLREIRRDRFILIRDDFRHGGRLDGLYVICSVQHNEEENKITINGKAAPYLLHRRATAERVLEGTTAGAAIAGIVMESTNGLPIRAGFVSAGDPEIIRYPMESGALDERSEDLLSYCGIGMEAVLEPGRIRLTYSAGRDISADPDVPVLGKESGRARNTSLTVDDSDYCNVAIGTLVFTDNREEPFSVGDTDTQGMARRELHIGEITQKTGESEEEFRERAETKANAALAARLLRTTVTADISPADYGKHYLVGDLVRVQVGPVTIKKRIIGATWLCDQSNDKISLTLGDQLNTVVAEIKEQEKANATKASGASIRAGGAARSAAENKEAITGIKTDFKALIARVDNVAAGMEAYVLEKVFEDYKLAAANLFAALQDDDETIKSELQLQASAIEGVQTATADLVTRVSGAESALNLKAEQKTVEELGGRIETIETAQADLTARVTGAESALNLKADSKTVQSLNGRIETVESASADLTARVTGAESALNLKADSKTVQSLNGRIETIETAQADLTARVTGAESALNLKAERKTVEELDGRVSTVESAQADLTARVTGAESALNLKADSKTVQALNGRVTTVESASADLTARVTGAESALNLKADSKTVQALNGRVTTIESASADLTARVTGAESALNLKADSKTVQALNGRVSTVESAQADLAARVTGAESSLSLKADSKTVKTLEGRVSTVESAQASLAARVTGAEASLDLKADSDTVKTLDGQIKTVEESQVSITSRVTNAEALIRFSARWITEKDPEIDGLASSVATIQADVIELQGNTEILGNLSIADGRLRVAKSIRSEGSVLANKFFSDSSEMTFAGPKTLSITTDVAFTGSGLTFGGKTYKPTEITSTTGAVLALGIA